MRDTGNHTRAGIHVSVEQETHEFLFGCIVPDLSLFSDGERHRYNSRLHEVFNRVRDANQTQAAGPDTVIVDASNREGTLNRIHLGVLRSNLDRLALGGRKLDVFVSGRTVGVSTLSHGSGSHAPSERDFGYRVADLYTLCFSHPSVRAIFWEGFSDGEATTCGLTPSVGIDDQGCGLLKRDLSPKHAHKILRKLIGTIWHSRANGETNSHGQFQFRGFFGNYRVVVSAGKTNATINMLSLSRNDDRSTPIVIEIPDV